jgi:hypothetical protein
MNISLKYGGLECRHDVASFDELLDRYPLNQFNSPRRATVPLLAYWKEPGRCLDFLQKLAIQPPADPDSLALAFEYEVDVQAGKGGPSITDLMLVGPKQVVAVEAKYTEPDYETVRDWLKKSNRDNRREVLQGWLSLINRTTDSQLNHRDVMDLPYQTVHRAASACFALAGEPGVSRHMIYQLFTDTDQSDSKIGPHLAALEKMIPSTALRLGCVVVRFEKKPAYRALEERWVKEKERVLRDDVRDGLRHDSLFEFTSGLQSSSLKS